MIRRVVVDTNVVISAFLWGGFPRTLLTNSVETGVILLTSEEILRELEFTLHKDKLQKQLVLSGKTIPQIYAEFVRITKLIDPSPVPENIVRDKKDRMVLAAAVGGKAEYLVSGDKDLTSLKRYQGITIVNPMEFLAILNPPDESEA